MIRRWGDASLSRAERRDFVESALGPDNLHRMFWLIIAFLPISIAGTALNVMLVHSAGITLWGFFDLGLAVLFLILTIVARRKGPAIRWKHALVLIYACYVLISMDGYYFSVRADHGENTYYILGVLMVAVVFRLPPQQFIPLLVGNHIIVTSYLLWTRPERNDLLFALFGGFNGVVIALVTAWFLFNNQWQTFERKRELTQANSLLTRRNAELNEVMAIAAHDLRSPLHSVKMIFDLLLDKKHAGEFDQAEILRDGSRACSDMLSLIGRLLNAHAVEHRLSRLHVQKVDLHPVIHDAVKRSQRVAELRGISCTTDLGANGEATTDPEILTQVLDNLLSNAIKYSPPNTEITIALLDVEGDCVIEVRDAGPGISESDQARIFEKYYRGGNKPAEEGMSSGLGLSIVKQLTETLGGSVSYRPNVPRGGVFTITFPRVPR